jgi:WD40 repeat protein
MGRVYAARQAGLGRIVALKVLGDGWVAGGELEMRFLREVQVVARLRHPNLVSLHDFGRDGGQVYFSMEYCEGGDLARRLRERVPEPREAAAWLEKLAKALACAHAEGILHRDIKPSNILLDGNEPRLADFGLACPLETGGSLTTVTGVLGTPHYLAPEVLAHGSAASTEASDLYAIGVVLFEMLTGRTPFAGAAPAALPGMVAASDPPTPSLLAPATPSDLETICLKCLDRDPRRRYASAAALADDLRRFLEGRPILARPLPGPVRFLRWCRRRPALAGVWLLVTALAVGSTLSTFLIREALRRAKKAEIGALARERDARLAEARAVRRTNQPGRRAQALAALAAAARIGPGADLRDEAIASLLLTDLEAAERWNIGARMAGQVAMGPMASIVSFEPLDAVGQTREPAELFRWGEERPLVRLRPPATNAVGSPRFSRDGNFIMERFLDDTLRVWRVGEEAPYLTVAGRHHPGGPRIHDPFNADYDFSPDSQTIALGLPASGLSLLRTADGSESKRWEGGGRFNQIRFSPDGHRLAAAQIDGEAAHTIYVLEIPSLSAACQFSTTATPNSIAWSGDGRLLGVSETDNSIEVHDVWDGRRVAQLSTPARDPNELAFVGSLLAVRPQGPTLHLLDLVTGSQEFVIERFGRAPIAVNPEGTSFVTASLESELTRWNIKSPVGLRLIPPPNPNGYDHSGNNCALDFTPDGQWALSTHARYFLIRNLASGRAAAEADAGEAEGNVWSTACFANGGQTIIRVSDHSGIQRFDISFENEGRVRIGPPKSLDAEAGWLMTDHTQDGRRLALVRVESGPNSAWSSEVRILDFGDGGLTTLSRWKAAGAYYAVFNPDASQALVNCAGTGRTASAQHMEARQVSDGRLLATLPAAGGGDAAWGADGETAMTSSGQSKSIVWDAVHWRVRATLDGDLGGDATTFAIAPDSSHAVVVKDDRVHLVSLASGASFATFQCPGTPGLCSSVRFLPNRRQFAILWHTGRLDCFDPDAINAALAKLGLDWH